MTNPDTPRNDGERTDLRDDTTFATTADPTSDPATDPATAGTTSATTDPADDTTQWEQTVHSDTTRQLDTTQQLGSERSEASEASEASETSRTRPIEVEDQSARDLFGNPVDHGHDSPVMAGAGPTPAPVLPERPSGPHAPAIVLGLVCLAVAGIILAQELGDLTVDWGNIGPVGIILTGAVLVLFGLVGLFTSRRDKTS